MKIPIHAAMALDALEAAGFESYIVGGCVRDSLLGREPQDWDICTAARPEETMQVFAGQRLLPTGLQHGTVTLLTDHGPLEITTFRTEGDYSDGRHPDAVAFVADIRADLSRRDFTVNAMAWSPRRGLVDPFGGQADLAAGLIRCVGEPERRFGEDALRILRCLRFAGRYGFAIHEDTAAALLTCRTLLERVSAERIFSELKGILCGAAAGELLRRFPAVFFAVLPELEPMLGLDHRYPRAHHLDVWGHTAAVVEAVPPTPVLRLTALLHDCGKPACYTYDEALGRGRFYGHPEAGAALADALLRRLRCDNATRETVCTLVAIHQHSCDNSPKAMRRLLARYGEETLSLLWPLRRADALAHAPGFREELLEKAQTEEALYDSVRRESPCLSTGELAVGGRDLMALGYAPGPALGQTLTYLLEQVLDEQLENHRETLLEAARIRLKEESL